MFDCLECLSSRFFFLFFFLTVKNTKNYLLPRILRSKFDVVPSLLFYFQMNTYEKVHNTYSNVIIYIILE